MEILSGYLPAFTKAVSGKSPECIYLDLMAGQPKNVERYTGDEFDGSPVVAMKALPPFTRLRCGELSASRAQGLETHLRETFPGDTRYEVAASRSSTATA